MKQEFGAQEHYDRLAERGHGADDPPILRTYMARWDGPLFYEALGDVSGKEVLEIGIGTGRVARSVLDLGCCSLTGLEISPRTLETARQTLLQYGNAELLLTDISDLDRRERYDVAYSVLTMILSLDNGNSSQLISEGVEAH